MEKMDPGSSRWYPMIGQERQDKLKHGNFHSNIRKKMLYFFLIRVLRLWNKLPKEFVYYLVSMQNLTAQNLG